MPNDSKGVDAITVRSLAIVSGGIAMVVGLVVLLIATGPRSASAGPTATPTPVVETATPSPFPSASPSPTPLPTSRQFVVNTEVDTSDANPGDNTCADASANCSLRAAVEESNAVPGRDTITVPSGTYQLNQSSSGGKSVVDSVLPKGPLFITDDLGVAGAGAADTVIRATLPAPNMGYGQVFSVHFSGRPNVTISNLTATGGNTFSGGGAIENQGNLTLSGVVVSNSQSDEGGGIFNDGKLTLKSSTLTGNSATHGAAIENRGIADIENSTISGNTAYGGGSGIDTFGGVTHVIGTTIVVDDPGATIQGVTPSPPPTTPVVSSERGEMFVNINGGGDCVFSLDSATNSLIAQGNCVGSPSGIIAPLAENGGGTPTHALLPGNAAQDGWPVDSCPATDQRGIQRPQGPACDIGAFELETVPATPTPTPSPTPTATAAPTPTASPGQPVAADVNCDGKVDGSDVVTILRTIATIATGTCSHAGDVNGDGKLDAFDALLVLKYLAGLIASFP